MKQRTCQHSMQHIPQAAHLESVVFPLQSAEFETCLCHSTLVNKTRSVTALSFKQGVCEYGVENLSFFTENKN